MRRRVAQRGLLASAAFTAVAAAFLFPGAAGAAVLKRPAPKPTVKSFVVAPARLGYGGGPVVAARPRGARVTLHVPAAAGGAELESDGRLRVRVRPPPAWLVAANGLESAQTVTFTLTAVQRRAQGRGGAQARAGGEASASAVRSR